MSPSSLFSKLLLNSPLGVFVESQHAFVYNMSPIDVRRHSHTLLAVLLESHTKYPENLKEEKIITATKSLSCVCVDIGGNCLGSTDWLLLLFVRVASSKM